MSIETTEYSLLLVVSLSLPLSIYVYHRYGCITSTRRMHNASSIRSTRRLFDSRFSTPSLHPPFPSLTLFLYRLSSHISDLDCSRVQSCSSTFASFFSLPSLILHSPLCLIFPISKATPKSGTLHPSGPANAANVTHCKVTATTNNHMQRFSSLPLSRAFPL
ncbi:hypothetical protein GGI35DRAFT_162564 [Trichoderma velutinum]